MLNNMNNFIKNKKGLPVSGSTKGDQGFSLIEMMIAMTVFILVMVVAIGSFMSSSDSAKKSKALRIAMDNVNFAMDNITRELRLGFNYADNSPTSQISFSPHDISVPIRYFYLNSSTDSIDKCDFALPPDLTAECSSLTSPEIEITNLRFTLYNSSTVGPNTQPSVYIEIDGEVDYNGTTETFSLYTLASQRNAE